jgi:hypothetical protein
MFLLSNIMIIIAFPFIVVIAIICREFNSATFP